MKNLNMVKIVLAIMLLLCLLNMSYGYYQFVRLISFFGFGYLAYIKSEQGLKNEMILFGALALLFQPFIKISLGRELWNVVDLIVGVGLIISIFRGKQKKDKY
jgi:predicted membrane protein